MGLVRMPKHVIHQAAAARQAALLEAKVGLAHIRNTCLC